MTLEPTHDASAPHGSPDPRGPQGPQGPKGPHDDQRSLDDLVRPGDVTMLTTIGGDGSLSSRPLTAADVYGGVVTFLVDAGAQWFDIVEQGGEVNLSIATGRNDWVSVRGRPAVSSDPTTIDRLWSPAAGAYFDGRDDPAIRALQVSVIDGEYWSAPGGGPLGRLAAIVGAALGRDEASAATNSHGELSRD